jgi:hypothetical protein
MSTSRYVFLLGGGGGGGYHGKVEEKPQLLTLSSIEFEYIFVVLTTKEILWLHQLFNDLWLLQLEVLSSRCDNQSRIALILNP